MIALDKGVVPGGGPEDKIRVRFRTERLRIAPFVSQVDSVDLSLVRVGMLDGYAGGVVVSRTWHQPFDITWFLGDYYPA